jgi:D-alanyl-D-alanine carboxypeptidase (penicillin-binding protein 5/6)
MQPTPPITARAMSSILRRHWRPIAGVAAALLAVTAVVQPWHHTAPAMHATATAATSPSAAVTPAHSVPRQTPPPEQAKRNPPGAKSTVKPGAKPTVKPVAVHVAATLNIPGTAPKMPWPSTGQSAIGIGGDHVLGVSGRQVAAPTASMAKAMTAYIVLRDHPLKAGQSGPVIHVTPAEAAVVALNRRQDQQVLTVRAGEAITEKQALNALMLKSANNVARILARWDAGSVPAFLTKMNANAAQLGMASTHYTDPSGWDAATLSTTTDQIKLAEHAMARADFAAVVATKSAIVPIEGLIRNVNPLLGQDGIVGIKTGSMSAAGGCLLFAARHVVSGKSVWILGTVMGQRSSAIGDLHQAFTSSQRLVEAMNRAVGAHTVITAGQVVATVPGTTRAGAHVGTVTVVGGDSVTVPVSVR